MIVEADASDAAAICELASHYTGSTRGWAEDELKDAISSKRYYVIVAKQEMSIVGYAIARLAWGKLHLMDIAVKEDMRRLGIGRKMLNHLINQANEWKLSEIYFEVRASNTPAIRMYSSLSFKTRFILPKLYNGEDVLAMHLPLED